MKTEYSPEDFQGFCECLNRTHDPHCNAPDISKWANTRLAELKKAWLEELLRDAVVVYGCLKENGFISIDWTTFPQQGRTHSAKLIDIREVGK